MLQFKAAVHRKYVCKLHMKKQTAVAYDTNVTQVSSVIITFVSVNEVAVYQAQLVLGWVWVCNQIPRSTQPGHPSVGVAGE